MNSFTERIDQWAERLPEKTALVFYERGGARSYSYGELVQRTRSVAAGLQARGLQGQRVLVCAEGADFVFGFLGCLHAGTVPVPAHQPRLRDKRFDRLKAMLHAAQLRTVLVGEQQVADFDALTDRVVELQGMELVRVGELSMSPADQWHAPQLQQQDVAFIQFTSGSTGDPKGVVISHGNLIHNQELMMRFCCTSQSSVGVSWLPLFHDMGLIHGLMHLLYCGGTAVLLTPMDFIRRPVRWLQLISEHRAVLSCAPNFGYSYAAQRIAEEDLAGVDLSCWQRAFNGSEQVQARTLRAFADRFSGYGFDARALMPVYGMAEATLLVTGHRRECELPVFEADCDALEVGQYGAAKEGARRTTLVGCGSSRQFQEILIVDPETCVECPENRVGEIWIRSGSVGVGYFNNAAATAHTFGACLRDGRGPFLRSGDLGLLHQDELVVVGRAKDLIILRGRNYYPQDLEQAVSGCHEALVQAGVAAVAGHDDELDGEALVIVAEVRGRSDELPAANIFALINTALADAHQVSAHDIVLVPAGAIPRTSSGKIRRRELLQRYQRDELPMRARSRKPTVAALPAGSIDFGAVCELLAGVLALPVSTVERANSLQALGLDSLRAASVCLAIETRWQRYVGMAELLAVRTLEDLPTLIRAAAPTPPETQPQVRVAHDGTAASTEVSTEAFPLTPMQQAYWIGRSEIFQLGGRSLHAYLEIEGDIDLARFERAWNLLISRHDMLRAVIDEEGRQRVLVQVPHYEIVVSDLRSARPEDSEVALQARRAQLSQLRHDLTQWPAFDVCATRLPDRVRLHLSVDGIYLDLRSFQVLLVQLIAAYQDEPLPCAATGISFRDYVLRLPAMQAHAAHQRSLDYWRGRIPALPAAPTLPLHTDPGTLRSAHMVRRSSVLSAERCQRMLEAAATQHLTPAAVLLTAYAQVLARWSREQALTINVPLFNRPPLHPDINNVIGNFSTFTLVGVQLGRSCHFLRNAHAVQSALHEAIEHSRVGGVELVRQINTRNGRIAGDGFPVVFTHLPAGLNDWDARLQKELAQGLGRLTYCVTHTPQVWLDCQVWFEDGALQLSWDCVDALFPAGCIDEVFTAYVDLLASLAEQASWDMLRHDLLPQRYYDLQASNHACRLPLPERSVLRMILDQGKQQPTATAVVAGGVRLTYEELLRAADFQAARLERQGVGCGSRVAILMHKGWEQVVAVLATLQCGAAYVPIDPDSPSARLQSLLCDCGAQVAMVQPQTRERVGADAGVAVEVVDETWRTVLPGQGVPFTSLAEPQGTDLAYVIYTSGTTGQPKGVMVPHRCLNSLVAITNHSFAVSAADSVLSVTSLHHDLSVYDVFGVLAAGGKLVVPLQEERRDPGAWLRLLQQERITLWNTVPALLEMLLDYMEGMPLQSPLQLRQGWIGGDVVTPRLIKKAVRALPNMAVCSIGGPTETTVWNIWYPIDADSDEWEHLVPYGKPAPNNRYHVLDTNLEPCPPGVIGEMYCAGDGVAAGYLNNPSETAAKFFWHEPLQERLYKSGDLGRLRADGNLEFCGRADHQIKIHGVRVEASEVESAILRHCPVSAAVVIATGPAGQQDLAAYIVSMTPADTLAEMQPHTGPVATDPAERLTVKMQRRGLRKLAEVGVELGGREPPAALRERYLQRQSIRSFQATPATVEQLGAWLAVLSSLQLPDQVVPKHRYPSGGGLYPVQLYIYVRPHRVRGLAGGYYYYDPEQHRLQPIMLSAIEPGCISSMRHIAAGSAFSIYLVAALSAVEPLYGRLSRDFCLLEAGCMSQLLMEQASAVGLGLCPVGFSDAAAVSPYFKLSDEHMLLHTMIGGPIEPAQLGVWLADEAAAFAADVPRGITARLQQLLPAALVPKYVVCLDRLPLTANGKVDRRALPLPTTATARSVELTQPATATEQRLASVWAELLGRPSIGINENFFEAGGNSTLLVQFHVRLRRDFGRELAISDLFKSSTIRQVAALLDEGQVVQPAAVATDARGMRQREAARKLRQGRVSPHG